MTQAVQAIEAAQAGIAEELIRHDNGRGTVSNSQQLKTISQRLEDMKRHLTEGAGGEIPNYGLGRLVSDSWPLDSPIGESILRAEQGYLRAMAKKV